MRIIVQKFGGTSLATTELRSRVCDIISASKEDGVGLVVVVSAMGRKNAAYATDTLIAMVKDINDSPSSREMDMLMACGETISGIVLANQLSARGIKASFLTGAQAGLVTDNNHGNAHILYINTKRVMEYLEHGEVVVVAGFQGLSENGELTTLGRGGSDTTASALGIALNAEYIDIFTDVEGIMTADPRIVEDAQLLDCVTYNEICQLAREGAKVVHPRAIEIAMEKGIPLRVRGTLNDSTGTIVAHNIYKVDEPVRIISDRLITGITYTSNIAQIKIKIDSASNGESIELTVFKSMADEGISIDFITVGPDNIMFTVERDSAEKTRMLLMDIGVVPEIEMECAKVAIVGAAMTGIPGIMSRVVEALAEAEVPILQSGDSYTNIWCLVKKENMEKAVKVLHKKFELGNNK